MVFHVGKYTKKFHGSDGMSRCDDMWQTRKSTQVEDHQRNLGRLAFCESRNWDLFLFKGVMYVDKGIFIANLQIPPNVVFGGLFCGHFKLLQCSSCFFFSLGLFMLNESVGAWIGRFWTCLSIVRWWILEFSGHTLWGCVWTPTHLLFEGICRGSKCTPDKPKVWLEGGLED